MKPEEQAKTADVRDKSYRKKIAMAQEKVGRRVPQQPVRDDRGVRQAWRPGSQ